VTRVVVCAPGYPSDTEEAQPTMDRLARALERAAGWSEGRIEAEYHPTLEGGLAALVDPPAIALVPLAFYLEQREGLGLDPLATVVQASGPAEVWSVVARRGAIKRPGDLAGWKLAGMPGYSPRFVQRVAFDGWGPLPADTEIGFSARVLSELRRALRGEPVAALLDLAQTEALDSLPQAADLEVVVRSKPLPGTLLCRVGPVEEAAEDELKRAFLGLDRQEGGRELLDTLLISHFGPLDVEGLERIERAFAAEEIPAR
jgi:ABC-type phosphate/phosphonate transport system substrate-binding protein